MNKGQFELFLKLLHGCIEGKNDLTCYNGDDFFVHIPYSHLVNCVIVTSTTPYKVSEHYKSKMESFVPTT